MKIISDKSIKIYNNVNIFHNYENEYVEKLAIDLSLYFSKKKVFWIFNDKKIPDENYIDFVIKNSKEINFVNILFLKKKLDGKKQNIFFQLMKNYGKKIIFVTGQVKKNPKDQSIFYCKNVKSYKLLKKNIIKLIENI